MHIYSKFQTHKKETNFACQGVTDESSESNTDTTQPLSSSCSTTEREAFLKKYRFLLEPSDYSDPSWELKMVCKYHSFLFKEYCLCDLSRWETGQLALRWRIESEVVSGKGQFICANIACENVQNLRSYEVNFEYTEEDIKKNALVKIKLCSECTAKLPYKKQKKIAEAQNS